MTNILVIWSPGDQNFKTLVTKGGGDQNFMTHVHIICSPSPPPPPPPPPSAEVRASPGVPSPPKRSMLALKSSRVIASHPLLNKYWKHGPAMLTGCLHFVAFLLQRTYTFLPPKISILHSEACRGYHRGADKHAHGDLVILTCMPSFVPRTSYFGLAHVGPVCDVTWTSVIIMYAHEDTRTKYNYVCP